MQLNRGKYGKDLSNELFSERQQNEMWKAHTNLGFTLTPNPRSQTHFGAYGLGWGIKDMQGKIIISHTGGLPGMLSQTILVPELKLGIVILTNSLPGGLAYNSIPQMILDSYMEMEEKDWIKEMADRALATGKESDSVTTAVWKVVEQKKSSEVDLGDYTGTYKDNWFGEIEIILKDG